MTQPKVIKGLNLITLPGRDSLELKNNLNDDQVEAFEKIINKYENIVIKAGGGSVKFSKELTEFSEHLNACSFGTRKFRSFTRCS